MTTANLLQYLVFLLIVGLLVEPAVRCVKGASTSRH
jgi:hypothetical protein